MGGRRTSDLTAPRATTHRSSRRMPGPKLNFRKALREASATDINSSHSLGPGFAGMSGNRIVCTLMSEGRIREVCQRPQAGEVRPMRTLVVAPGPLMRTPYGRRVINERCPYSAWPPDSIHEGAGAAFRNAQCFRLVPVHERRDASVHDAMNMNCCVADLSHRGAKPMEVLLARPVEFYRYMHISHTQGGDAPSLIRQSILMSMQT